jgi:very-short-patch-repair endonuclease
LLDVDKQRDITTFNQVAQKSVDFVITATTKDNNITTVAVIELDDKSHLAKNRQIADRVKNAALEQAGITLFRWTVKDMPDVETIQKLFLG